MKLSLIILFISAFHAVTFAQNGTPDDKRLMEGKWTLEKAVINRHTRGRNEQVHVLSRQEVGTKQIPSLLAFKGDRVTATIQKQKKTSEWSFNKGYFSFGEPEAKSVFMAWKEKGVVLVLVSEYKQTDFAGNQLRLTYRKNH